MEELNIKIDNIKDELSELKLLILKLSDDLMKERNLSNYNICDKKYINLHILKEGFPIDIEFIHQCFSKYNIIGDIELFKKYYFSSEINFPIRKNNGDIEYYENKNWKINNNKYVENIILKNIINTYIQFIINHNQLNINYNDGSIKNDNIFDTIDQRVKYTEKLETDKKYRKMLIDEIFLLF